MGASAAVALPPLTGTRDRVEPMLAEAGVPTDLQGYTVQVDGYKTLAGTTSFAYGLVKEILVVRRADRLVVRLVDEDFIEDLTAAAELFQVSDRLTATIGPSDG